MILAFAIIFSIIGYLVAGLLIASIAKAKDGAAGDLGAGFNMTMWPLTLIFMLFEYLSDKSPIEHLTGKIAAKFNPSLREPIIQETAILRSTYSGVRLSESDTDSYNKIDYLLTDGIITEAEAQHFRDSLHKRLEA